MKLKLTSQDHIDVLTASETITAKDISVLKAGITKLFQNGKNKIVFELPATGQDSIPQEVIRELGMLDNFARELAGRVVVVSTNPEVLTRIQAFASPPLILCYSSREEALAVFAAPAPIDAIPDAPEVEPAPPAPAEVAAPLASPPIPGGLTKEDFLARELGDLGQIRKQLAAAEQESRLLQTQIVQQVLERRAGVSTEALQEKIVALELEVEKLLSQQPKAK